MTEPGKARFTRVIAVGASQVVPAGDGCELRIYRSAEDAVLSGMERETAERLFKQITRSDEASDIAPLCQVVNDPYGNVSCEHNGCPGPCMVYSVAANWQLSDPPRREGTVAVRQVGRTYWCDCDRGEAESGEKGNP